MNNAAGPWISVKDKLPSQGVDVLCAWDQSEDVSLPTTCWHVEQSSEWRLTLTGDLMETPDWWAEIYLPKEVKNEPTQ